MHDRIHFVRVDFTRFKAFSSFSLRLRTFNVLVGPNNAGKSTILTAFRILAVAMRKASKQKAEVVDGPHGDCWGYNVDLSSLLISEENIFHNYDSSAPAEVNFTLSNRNSLLLYFPTSGKCKLIVAGVRPSSTPASFRSAFNCPIATVPILGPVESDERPYQKEAARLALINYRAARNFRNIWYHFGDQFNEFRALLRKTWPGMDIQPPEIDYSGDGPRLFMLCPEERKPREIYWAGLGFQVWCQMLTHLVQSSDSSLFLIDEPDIYLHSDLQRQLINLLRHLGPDILIATHSTEMISEVEPEDIVVIDKRRKMAKRLKNPSDLSDVFGLLGSRLNPILTQVAKTRRAIFVEGQGDFKILARFAHKFGLADVANRAGFAVVPVQGFNPQKIRNLLQGMEATLGTKIVGAAILDRDYRCDGERQRIAAECRQFCQCVAIYSRKEIENFLLVPDAIDRAAERKVAERVKRTGESARYSSRARQILDQFANAIKNKVSAQCAASRKHFERSLNPKIDEATIVEAVLEDLEKGWGEFETRISVVPGKEALAALNGELERQNGVCLTPAAIIDAMKSEEVPREMQEIVHQLEQFATSVALD